MPKTPPIISRGLLSYPRIFTYGSLAYVHTTTTEIIYLYADREYYVTNTNSDIEIAVPWNDKWVEILSTLKKGVLAKPKNDLLYSIDEKAINEFMEKPVGTWFTVDFKDSFKANSDKDVINIPQGFIFCQIEPKLDFTSVLWGDLAQSFDAQQQHHETTTSVQNITSADNCGSSITSMHSQMEDISIAFIVNPNLHFTCNDTFTINIPYWVNYDFVQVPLVNLCANRYALIYIPIHEDDSSEHSYLAMIQWSLSISHPYRMGTIVLPIRNFQNNHRWLEFEVDKIKTKSEETTLNGTSSSIVTWKAEVVKQQETLRPSKQITACGSVISNRSKNEHRKRSSETSSSRTSTTVTSTDIIKNNEVDCKKRRIAHLRNPNYQAILWANFFVLKQPERREFVIK
jgi:hypothetical protein